MNEETLADFKCLRCGNCCTITGSVNLKRSETALIAGHLGMALEMFTEMYTELNANRIGLRLKDNTDGSCIFLGRDRLCQIEEVKPKQCCGFPKEWNYAEWKKVCSANYPNTGRMTEGK